MKTKEELRTEILNLMSQADSTIKEAQKYLIAQGEVVDLTEWVTIKEYCKRFGIKNTETVSNWIKRGVIPAEDTMVIEDLNNIRMVRAKEYHVGAAKAT
ncbi:hypothetical protein GCM10027275_24730 [Rhabdobacter roseus]|uniref:Uncharacterized protein n=1 Tax=Rhabdobacter roseus TaxID=1655419 RepID=A0A840TT17_9BACT|nr:hypothetical protein [Rhabdobacter roseus]MBB5284413.1 hypothetical protein [Rhabdobacter roseus]